LPITYVKNWTSASRLRFNPSKTEIMWLGAGNLQQVDISDIPVLSSTVRVVQSARDLGVILDSQLSLSAHIAALCRSGFHQLRQIRPAIRSLTPDAARTVVQALCLSFRLVQLASVWCAREPAKKGAVSTERCCSSTHQRSQMWPHHSTAASVTLAASPETSGVQDCVSCTPVTSFTCTDQTDYWHSSRLRVRSSPSAVCARLFW